MRTRPDGTRFCRACQTENQRRRRHGDQLLDIGSIRMKINRAAFAQLCRGAMKPKRTIMELSGIGRDSIGALYARGFGPRHRKALCETLRVEHDMLFNGGV